jgi:hypothetical protein
MEVSRYNITKDKRFWGITETAILINEELKLNARNMLLPSTLSDWRKEGYITYTNSKFNENEVKRALGFSYLHIFLGINFKRIEESQKYLSNLTINHEHLKKYINLYERNHK